MLSLKSFSKSYNAALQAAAVTPDFAICYAGNGDALNLPAEVNAAIAQSRERPSLSRHMLSLHGYDCRKKGPTAREKYIYQAESVISDALENGDRDLVSPDSNYIKAYPFMPTHRAFFVGDNDDPIEVLHSCWSYRGKKRVMYIYGAWNAHGVYHAYALAPSLSDLLLCQEIKELRSAKTVSPWASLYITPDNGATVVCGNVIRFANAIVHGEKPPLKDYGSYNGRYANLMHAAVAAAEPDAQPNDTEPDADTGTEHDAGAGANSEQAPAPTETSAAEAAELLWGRLSEEERKALFISTYVELNSIMV